jgi:putative FmdB family regulatory protein
MPIYEFECKNHEPNPVRFDVIQNADEEHTACCPDCGQPAQRVWGPVVICFNGPGFHVNDYPSGKH